MNNKSLPELKLEFGVIKNKDIYSHVHMYINTFTHTHTLPRSKKPSLPNFVNMCANRTGKIPFASSFSNPHKMPVPGVECVWETCLGGLRVGWESNRAVQCGL